MLDAMKKIPEGEKVEKVSIEYSIGKGLYCKLYGDVRPTQEFLDKVKAKMKELVELDMPIKKRLMKTREAIELFKSMGWKIKQSFLNIAEVHMLMFIHLEHMKIILWIYGTINRYFKDI